MWTFKGTYSGEAKAYVKRAEKKLYVVFSVILGVVLLGLIVIPTMIFGEDLTIKLIILGGVFGIIALEAVVMLIAYMAETQCTIEIVRDNVTMYLSKSNPLSFSFYYADKIEIYNDCIVISKGNTCVLQKELLVEGDWEELKALLKKVKESLDTEEPMYQIEEPETEFFEATVKGKRIYEKFVHRVSIHVAEGVFQFFVTFQLENDEEMEFEIGQEWYEKLEKGQTGTLVLVGGNFFDFGDGEEME